MQVLAISTSSGDGTSVGMSEIKTELSKKVVNLLKIKRYARQGEILAGARAKEHLFQAQGERSNRLPVYWRVGFAQAISSRHFCNCDKNNYVDKRSCCLSQILFLGIEQILFRQTLKFVLKLSGKPVATLTRDLHGRTLLLIHSFSNKRQPQ